MDQELIKKLMESMTAEQIAELSKQKKTKEKDQQQKAKEEESSTIDRWNAFVKAEKVLKETDMKFYRDSQPKYFRKLKTTSKHKKTEVEYINTEVKFYPPSSLGENWIELKDQRARDMFRIMVEGGELIVKDPETNETIKKTYEPRVFDKITNTLKVVDNITYNMLDLSDKLEPNWLEGTVPQCPLIHKALFIAISGNEIETMKKPENLDWLEKWIYGTIHADIGNNMTSFPVIYGPGKVGRNALFDVVLKQCLGKEACFSGTWDLIHGNFDGYKLGKVMMFIDEVPEKGSWDVLKNMTGSTDSFVKQKYGAEFVIDNTIRYAIGTNEETYPLPVENGPQMMRVSPIKTNRNSTFAENTVKLLDMNHGEGYCRKTLKESDETLDVDNMTNFMVGDTLLRNVLQKDWASRDACQQLLNYLDYTFKSESGNYSLAPLRGSDWDTIIRDKIPAINQVVDYLIEQDIETITTLEMYEIYKVIQQDRSDMVKKMQGFSQSIADLMSQAEYKAFHQAYIDGDTRTTIYTNTTKEHFKDYKIDIDRYIVDVQMGTNVLGPKHRKLKYRSKSTDSTITGEIPQFLKNKFKLK
jgi:hypothetical protein